MMLRLHSVILAVNITTAREPECLDGGLANADPNYNSTNASH